MKKNKLILFDWGGIVEDNKDWKDFYTMLFEKCGVTTDVNMDYKLSSIPTEEEFKKVFEKMKQDNGLKVDFYEFVDFYKEIFSKCKYFTDVRNYEHSLKDKCYIGILSNLIIYDRDRIDMQLELDKYDYVFLSYELACRKPDKEIYEKVQKKLPFDKKDILFIDDRMDNCEVAKEFGWNVLNATGLELGKIKETCEEFLND